MKKILFVEDELTDNISRVLNIFSGIFNAGLKKELRRAEENMAFPNEVKEIIEKSLMVDVCYSFPDALEKIMANCDVYSLFIIDRDLSEQEYEAEAVLESYPEYNEETQIRYCRREGDFLLSILRDKTEDYNSKVYFLTGNTGDALKCANDLGEPGLSGFIANNIINKSDDDSIKKLANVIEDFRQGNFRVKLRNVFEVFEKGLLTQKDEQRLVETLRRMDEDNPTSIEDNLVRIRRLLEAVYIELAKRKPELIPADRIKYEKEQLLMSAIFNHLKESGGQPDFVNSLSWDIWKICSKYGAHSQAEKGDHAPSKHTVQSLAHALCEVLLWFKADVE